MVVNRSQKIFLILLILAFSMLRFSLSNFSSVDFFISRLKIQYLYMELNSLCMFVCYSSVLLFTASLPGRETFMFHYLIDFTSITLLSFHAGFSCVRTTAPTKLSSSRCGLPLRLPTSCGLVGGNSERHRYLDR